LKENTRLSARWEEQEVANDPSKCEKIILNISYSGSHLNESIITITVYVSTGRIQLQGKFLNEWGNTEFDMLLKIIDSGIKINSVETSGQSLEDFINEVMKENENTKKPKTINSTTEIPSTCNEAQAPHLHQNSPTQMNKTQ
jgi:hypothetical protein